MASKNSYMTQNALNNIKKNKYLIVYILCICIISLKFATQRIYISDFYPINGDFQNYNAFRRVLNGEIPYRDFSNYLGIGVLILNVPLLILNNSFTSSLFVTNFTTCLVFCISISTLCYTCTNNKEKSMIIGAVAPMLCKYIQKVQSINSIFVFSDMFRTGNSMRMQRAFLPFLLVILFIIFQKIYKIKTKKEFLFFDLIGSGKNIAIAGLIIGGSIIWSNDFGFASFGSAFLIILLLNINTGFDLRYFKIISIFILTGVIGFFMSVFIVTGGKINSFIDFTCGVASYQFWYYGVSNNKLLYIEDIFKNSTYNIYLILFFILTIKFIMGVKNRKIKSIEILAYFICLTTFIASVIYIYGSGGYMIESFALSITIVYLSYIINIIDSILKRYNFRDVNKIGFIVLITISSMYIYGLIEANIKLKEERGVPYIEELNGYTTYGTSLKEAKELIGDEKVFSTYASALEVMLGQYQPSGTDYIIHVLGDGKRIDYLEEFNRNNYKYVTTIRDDFSPYESWVKRANWFFYKELYSNYKPIKDTDYSTIWEKSENLNLKYSCDLEYNKINNSTYEINVKSNSKENIVVDALIHYETTYKNNISKLKTFKNVVCITDESMGEENKVGWTNYFIPSKHENYNIPIFLKNGKGKIIITSEPQNITNLDIVDIKVNNVLYNYNAELYNDYYKNYEKKIQAMNFTDENWISGIGKKNNNKKTILIENTNKNRGLLKNATKIKYESYENEIVDIEYIDNSWIWVTLDNDENIAQYSYPNQLEVL